MPHFRGRWSTAILLAAVTVGTACPASAHHILGRPSYNVDGDASTPPSISLEVQIGHFNVTMMAFPIQLKARQPVRVKLYATRLDGGKRFDGNVTFSVRDDSWFPATEEVLAVQRMDDNGVYSQGMEFKQDGDYVISAKYEADTEPYVIDFPVTVGNPMPKGFLAGAAGLVAVVLTGISLAKRKRRAKEDASRSAP